MKGAILSLLDAHWSSREAVLTIFLGDKRPWHVYPLDDQTASYWFEDGGKVVHSEAPFTADSVKAGVDVYSGEVVGPFGVVRREGLALVAVDTNTDGNAFFMVLDEDKECKDAALKELYHDCW